MSSRKILGIVGGMGSVAAAHFFKRLVELTPAKTDQEYIEIFIHNNTMVPDRTRGILCGEMSPLPELQRSVSILNKIGVDYIVSACMTSHYFIQELQKSSRAKLIDGAEETAKHIRSKLPEVKKVGVLASTGAIKVSVFQSRLSDVGIETVVLDKEDQQKYFMEPVYAPWGIKAGHTVGRPGQRLHEASEILVRRGAEAIIAGCTEVPVVLKEEDIPVPLVDAVDILARTAILLCMGIEAK